MKQSALIVLLLAALSACNPSKNSDGPASIPNAGTLGTLSNTQWSSTDCQYEGRRGGAYIEKITLQNSGTGTVQTDYMQYSDCTGSVISTRGPTTFTYTTTKLDASSTQILITYQDGRQASAVISGGVMSVISQGRTTYFRQSSSSVVTASEIGTWITSQCAPDRRNGSSYKHFVTFLGNGQGTFSYTIYRGFGCRGLAQQTSQSTFGYKSNGRGQITIDGEPSAISIQDNEMTWNTGRGRILYIKMN